MQNVPYYVSFAFVAITLLSCYFFYLASSRQKFFLYIITAWLALQGIVAAVGFYSRLPLRFPLLIAPPLLLILLLFITKKGRAYLDSLDMKYLTLLHVVRIPVEAVLYVLSVYKVVPEIMTFEGNNYDILSGITAIIVYYFVFVKKQFGRNVLLLWNIACLGLLVNIVITAILSAPLPFQKLAFEQPNIALLYFPFIWLPCCVVPLVLLSHLASIRRLMEKA